MKKKYIFGLDLLGTSAASSCLMHCLIFPLLSIFPLGYSNNHWIDVFFVCIAMFVVSKILLSNTQKKVKIILAASIIVVIIGVFLEIFWSINTTMLPIGGIGMIVGHLLNYNFHTKQNN
jgi:hypothetical protein